MPNLFRPLAVLALVALPGAAPAQKPFADPVLERMREDVFFLASPECEGRGIDTKGIEKAAERVVTVFQEAGLKPAMKNGSYFQPFQVTMSSKLGKPTALTLAGPDGVAKEPKLGTDYSPMGFSPTSKAKGELVFAGYGITAPTLKYDDYAGLDVEGKVVVILRRIPRYNEKGDKRFDTAVTASDDSTHAAFVTKIENARAHKAAALVIVNDTTAAGKADPLPQYAMHSQGTTPAKFPVLFLSRAAFDGVLAAADQKSLKEIEDGINANLKPQSFALKGWTADAVVTVERKEVTCKNIVGVLEGSGPLKGETVVIGAHYDHVGYGTFGSAGGPSAKGKIHYGADDNASGTTGLMELARRFGAQKDRQGRRLVFIAFSAEEIGLNGSQFYCKQPLFPLDKTVAMVNMDMIGRTKPVPTDWLGLFGKKDRLVVYGTGTSAGFAKLVDEAGKKVDFKLSTIAAGTGPSDHDSFYRKKIPVLFLYTGTHGEYHKPTDVPEKIDVPGMKKAADFAGLLLADLTTSAAPEYVAVKDPWSDPTDPRPARMSGPRLGILPSYTFEGAGVLLEGVSPGGPAEKAGLKDGDIIVEIGGKATPSVVAYMTAMGAQKLGTSVDIVVERKGKKLTLKAKLE